MSEDEKQPGYKNVGGTKGGFWEFGVGVILLIVGGYLFMDNVTVSSMSSSRWSGAGTFGLSLLPLFAGITFLFVDGKSWIGWLLAVAGAAIIFVGVIARLNVYWRPVTLYYTLAIIGCIAAGLGLIVRAIRAH
jgi:uncharacterized protein